MPQILDTNVAILHGNMQQTADYSVETRRDAVVHIGSSVGDTIQAATQAVGAGRIFVNGLSVGVMIALAIAVYAIAKKK